ncbi:hypothetical protein [Streptomyces sp. 4R-3d]|uniref:hypothetical protein n=1 Tax=Streptomyces sp. 4R-3d TaxID=2559605 RepID=UPI001072AD31|nr:hypothetical protein [Streptomyces sp. 4R-3d]TFI30116.1 hypothetical protein E4P36_05035 [Streptomyces sp. 4R-3d]
MTTPLPAQLVDYLVKRDAERADAVAEFLGSLTDREHALIREAAVMGYVQGRRHPRDENHPKDSAVLRLVIDAALAIPDLYPAIAAVKEQTTTSTLEYFVQIQQPDGTWEQGSSASPDPAYIQQQFTARKASHPEWESRIAWRTSTVTTGQTPRIVPALAVARQINGTTTESAP